MTGWDLGADNRRDAEFESPWRTVAHLLLINLILKVMRSSLSCKNAEGRRLGILSLGVVVEQRDSKVYS